MTTPQEIERARQVLADRVICDRCGATFTTYMDFSACKAALDEACPGFVAVEEAMKS